MEKLIEILEGLNPEVDYEKEDKLIDNRLLDSLTILSLIAEIEEAFDVEVPAVDIIPENFNSAAKIWELIQRLED